MTLRVCTMADRVLDGPLRTVGLAIPGLEVFVTSSPGDDAVEAVRQARADAAVVWSRPQEHRDLDGVVLGSVLFGIVLPLGHPLADRAEIPVAGLGSESAVMFPLSPFAGIWQRTVDHLLPRGAQPGQVVVEPDLINSPEAMLRAVAAGSGVAPGILGVVEHMEVERDRRAAARSPLAPRSGGRLAPTGPPRRPPPRRLPRRGGRRPGGPRLGSPSSPAAGGGQGLRTTFSQPSSLFLKMS